MLEANDVTVPGQAIVRVEVCVRVKVVRMNARIERRSGAGADEEEGPGETSRLESVAVLEGALLALTTYWEVVVPSWAVTCTVNVLVPTGTARPCEAAPEATTLPATLTTAPIWAAVAVRYTVVMLEASTVAAEYTRVPAAKPGLVEAVPALVESTRLLKVASAEGCRVSCTV